MGELATPGPAPLIWGGAGWEMPGIEGATERLAAEDKCLGSFGDSVETAAVSLNSLVMTSALLNGRVAMK